MRPRVLQSLGLKLFSLVLGFSLWYIVAGGQGAEIVLSVPLEYRNMPQGVEVIQESATQVEVRLRGTPEILRGLSAQDIQASVDLSVAEPGEKIIYLTPEDVLVPFGVRVMRVAPASLKLQLDRTARRMVRVVPRVVGSPAAGFELASIALDSPEIEVAGPASRLEALEQVTTEPVSAEGLRESYSQVVRVLVEDPYVRPLNPQGVEVTLLVREERIRRTLSGVALSSRPSSVNARLSVKSVQVEIEGPRALVERVRAEDLGAELSLEGLAPGVHTISPTLALRRPELAGIEIISVQPREVRVRIPASEAR